MNELQQRLINLENIVTELNILYKYDYTESDLIKLNKQYTIEEIDQTKDNIEILLFNMIIDAVINGAKPQNIRVYHIIDAYSYSLGLRERKDYINFLDKVNFEVA